MTALVRQSCTLRGVVEEVRCLGEAKAKFGNVFPNLKLGRQETLDCSFGLTV